MKSLEYALHPSTRCSYCSADLLQRSQKLYNMIDAVPWYQGKLDMQAYLRHVNKDKKVSDMPILKHYDIFVPSLSAWTHIYFV